MFSIQYTLPFYFRQRSTGNEGLAIAGCVLPVQDGEGQPATISCNVVLWTDGSGEDRPTPEIIACSDCEFLEVAGLDQIEDEEASYDENTEYQE